MLSLYGFVRSRSDRPHWTLEECGVPYQFFRLNFRREDHRSASFLALNPAGKIPVLQDGDWVLTESAAICNYVADTYAAGELAPQPGSRERAQYERWLYFVMTELEQPLWTKGKHILGRLPEPLRRPDIMDAAHFEWREALDLLAQGLGSRPFMLGDRFTVVDICIVQTLDWATRFEFPIEDKAVRAYADRHRQRPAYTAYQHKDPKDFPRPDLPV